MPHKGRGRAAPSGQASVLLLSQWPPLGDISMFRPGQLLSTWVNVHNSFCTVPEDDMLKNTVEGKKFSEDSYGQTLFDPYRVRLPSRLEFSILFFQSQRASSPDTPIQNTSMWLSSLALDSLSTHTSSCLTHNSASDIHFAYAWEAGEGRTQGRKRTNWIQPNPLWGVRLPCSITQASAKCVQRQGNSSYCYKTLCTDVHDPLFQRLLSFFKAWSLITVLRWGPTQDMTEPALTRAALLTALDCGPFCSGWPTHGAPPMDQAQRSSAKYDTVAARKGLWETENSSIRK